jgi:putative ABC transport system permease protein
VTFALHVSPAIIAVGVIAACLVGLVGGIVPAARAGRQSIATTLRG